MNIGKKKINEVSHNAQKRVHEYPRALWLNGIALSPPWENTDSNPLTP